MRTLKLVAAEYLQKWALSLPPGAIPVRVQYDHTQGTVVVLVLADWKAEVREKVDFFTTSLQGAAVPDDAWPVGCIDIAGVTYCILYRMTPSMVNRLVESAESEKPPGMLDYVVAGLETLEGER